MSDDAKHQLQRLRAELEAELASWRDVGDRVAEWLTEGNEIRHEIKLTVESIRRRRVEVDAAIREQRDGDDADWWKSGDGE